VIVSSSDASGVLYDAGGMDAKSIRRAALITLHRAHVKMGEKPYLIARGD
jgi:hypothetical protein